MIKKILFTFGIIAILILGVGTFAVAQGLITITFDTDRTDIKVAKCGSDIQCWSNIELDGSFARFFTMIHEDGTSETVILIEEYPTQAEEVVEDAK